MPFDPTLTVIETLKNSKYVTKGKILIGSHCFDDIN